MPDQIHSGVRAQKFLDDIRGFIGTAIIDNKHLVNPIRKGLEYLEDQFFFIVGGHHHGNRFIFVHGFPMSQAGFETTLKGYWSRKHPIYLW
jgi:hypothetical protein